MRQGEVNSAPEPAARQVLKRMPLPSTISMTESRRLEGVSRRAKISMTTTVLPLTLSRYTSISGAAVPGGLSIGLMEAVKVPF